MTDRRATPRIDTTLAVLCRIPASPQRATILDLSRTGCRMSLTESNTPIGATINVQSLQGLKFTGVIVWSTGVQIGVRFEKSLSERDLAELTGQGEPECLVSLEPREPITSAPRDHWIRRAFRLLSRS